jgi:hypothetical protein
MFPSDLFMRVDEELHEVLEKLRRREPIFHTPEFGVSISDMDAAMSPDYWEVGASGRRYSREFILDQLPQRPHVDAASAGWQTEDFGLRRLGPDTYLLTYTLHQGERITRRATIWEHAAGHWQILYHQGTIVTEEGVAAASNAL